MSTVPPADSILAIDIGNTSLGVGVWDGDGIHDTRHTPLADADTWRASLHDAWNATRGTTRAVVIGTVNRAVTPAVQSAIEEVADVAVYRVRDDLPVPIQLNLDNIREVGVDRACCAAAAYDRVQTACAVASVGTAVTVDCVSNDGEFLGGAILPGLQMSCNALHDGTDQLPRIEPRLPTSVFGCNTHDAISNGVAYGLVGAIREIVERYATALREWPQLIITGGGAPLVADLADFVDAVVPDLCLVGIALAYRRAADQA